MNIFPIGVGIGVLGALGLINPVLFRRRNIGGFVADVTIFEQHVDELTITEHPVEQGAAITDHAFKRPASVLIQVGYSNSSFSALGDLNYVSEVYDAFLQLQASRQPFDIVTGKRSYRNMLFSRLSTPTNERTENALFLTCECREVILVNTQIVGLPDNSVQKNPEITGSTQNAGTLNLQNGANYNGGFSQ